MSVEFRCPGCAHGFVLEQNVLEAAGNALPCPTCGMTLDLSRLAAAAAASPASVAPQVPVAAPTGASAAAALAAQPQPASPPDAGEEVVCPRCHLHFHPRRGAAAREGSARPTVLLVEDMEYFREVGADALSDRFEVRKASSSTEALSELAHGGIDLIILDLVLDESENGGAALLQRLQPKPCPVLIFTAREETEINNEWDRLRGLGADDVVRKGMHAGEALLQKCCGLLGLPEDDTERA